MSEQIDRIEKQGEGYNVYLKDSDMVVYVHLPEEVKALEKSMKKSKKGKK